MPQYDQRVQHLTERLAENLLLEPLEFLSAEHHRQRLLCEVLSAMAADWETRLDQSDAALVSRYLEDDFQFSLADKSESLYPVLRSHEPLPDDVSAVLQALEDEIETDRLLSLGLKECLQEYALASHPHNERKCRKLTATFTEMLRKHSAWEKTLILPAARRHLTAAETRRLGREMAERRSIEYPGL